MKKIVKVFTLIIFILLVSGCAKNTFNVNIKNVDTDKACNCCNDDSCDNDCCNHVLVNIKNISNDNKK